MSATVVGAYVESALANGYYLVGTMSQWTPAAENLFAENTETEGEYQLDINLAAGDSVKVVYVENDAIAIWYPAEEGNYVIDDHHSGSTTMYFRPDYQGGEGWYARCIYVIPTSTVDIINTDAKTEAVKVLRDGQLLIMKGGKTYNIIGAIVR